MYVNIIKGACKFQIDQMTIIAMKKQMLSTPKINFTTSTVLHSGDSLIICQAVFRGTVTVGSSPFNSVAGLLVTAIQIRK